MLIVNDDYCLRAEVCNLNDLYPYYGFTFTDYLLVMSDDAAQAA